MNNFMSKTMKILLDIWRYVSEYLIYDDFSVLIRTCKELYDGIEPYSFICKTDDPNKFRKTRLVRTVKKIIVDRHNHPFRDLANITSLEICPMFIDSDHITCINDSLKTLKVSNISFVRDVPGLRELVIQNCFVHSLCGLETIEKLSIEGTNLDDVDFSSVRDLRELSLKVSEDDAIEIVLPEICSITSLILWNVTLNNMGNFHRLVSLNLSGSNITNSDLRHFSKLQKICLKDCGSITDISILRGLKDIYIRSCPIASEGIRDLCPRRLELIWTNITEITCDISELKYLVIESTPVKELPHIDLDNLSLCDTMITDLSKVKTKKLTLTLYYSDILRTVWGGLEEIYMINCLGDYPLNNFKSLRKLHWATSMPNIPGLSKKSICGLGLQELYLGNNKYITSINNIKTLKTLTCHGRNNALTYKGIKKLSLDKFEVIDNDNFHEY